MYGRVIRECPNRDWCTRMHTWEYLNPDTEEPYKRGRVVFFCHRYITFSSIERMRMLRGLPIQVFIEEVN